MDRPPGSRGPSAKHEQNRKMLELGSQPHLSITGSPKRLKLLRQDFGEMKSIAQGCYAPKISIPKLLNHRESRINRTTTMNSGTNQKRTNRRLSTAFERSRSHTKMRKASTHDPLKEIREETPPKSRIERRTKTPKNSPKNDTKITED